MLPAGCAGADVVDSVEDAKTRPETKLFRLKKSRNVVESGALLLLALLRVLGCFGGIEIWVVFFFLAFLSGLLLLVVLFVVVVILERFTWLFKKQVLLKFHYFSFILCALNTFGCQWYQDLLLRHRRGGGVFFQARLIILGNKAEAYLKVPPLWVWVSS